jgi:fermentation-respiration switch protein FrsA (DUF1100 family)
VVVAVMYVAQGSLLYPGATSAPDAMPPVAPWGVRVDIATPDGETLAGLHVPAGNGRPTMLLFPGNGDNIANYGFLAEMLSKQGYGLLAVSYRGYPGSTGSPHEAGLLTDGLAAFDWLAAHAGSSPIVVLGRSLGTGVAVNTAAERDAAAVVLVSAYESIAALARSRYPYLPVGVLIRDSYRSDLRIGKISEPKLFLHGDLDTSIPLASGKALFEAAPEPKTFSVQRGRSHNDIWTSGLVKEIVAFFAPSNTIPSEPTPLEGARRYIEEISTTKEHFYLFPTRQIQVDVVGSQLIRNAVHDYAKIRENIYTIADSNWIPSISIVQLIRDPNGNIDTEKSISSLTLPRSFKNLIKPSDVVGDGCTAFKFINRDAWAAGGAVFIDTYLLAAAGEKDLNRCIGGALDYIIGIPARERLFNYSTIPPSDVSGVLLGAIYECSTEGQTDLEPAEESRDGITARPTVRCVSAKLGK